MSWGGDWIAGPLAASGAAQIQRGAFGLRELRKQNPNSEIIYDLASLTKVMATGTRLATLFLERGEAWTTFLNTPLLPLLPELDSSALAKVTLGDCWEHRSGLAPFCDFNDPPRGGTKPPTRATVEVAILKKLGHEKLAPGQTIYSDLGFLLLGIYLERHYQKNLAELFSEWKNTRRLKAPSLRYGVDELARLAPTENRYPLGEVNDDRAALLGGIAAHAGLFGSAADVFAWLQNVAQWVLTEPRLREWVQVPASHSARFFRGWDRPQDPATSSAGEGWSPHVIGFLGYTGTALFWDPQKQWAGVLLTNRVFPGDSAESKQAIKNLRRQYFTKVWAQSSNVGEIFVGL